MAKTAVDSDYCAAEFNAPQPQPARKVPSFYVDDQLREQAVRRARAVAAAAAGNDDDTAVLLPPPASIADVSAVQPANYCDSCVGQHNDAPALQQARQRYWQLQATVAAAVAGVKQSDSGTATAQTPSEESADGSVYLVDDLNNTARIDLYRARHAELRALNPAKPVYDKRGHWKKEDIASLYCDRQLREEDCLKKAGQQQQHARSATEAGANRSFFEDEELRCYHEGNTNPQQNK